ncbi:hypothetical protein ACG5V6_02475 [Streptomyces chitinivorans]|uniref:Uncharacterized protein n=1 Tax=Streptomyces chitinivorans TaxID=1257027 RepID=A0ABW7HN67_9ACTN|nr:hypothetical protein [Streptomyces chitinivorans]MDH2411523.1 hypothetical protein [Streptomyces chitinivorans]
MQRYADDHSAYLSSTTTYTSGAFDRTMTETAFGTTRAAYGCTAYGSDESALFTGADKPDGQTPEGEEDPRNAYRLNGHRWDAASGS